MTELRSHTIGSANAYPAGDFRYVRVESGLSKRELFAAMAMQGILARDAASDMGCAAKALAYADALINALTDEEKTHG